MPLSTGLSPASVMSKALVPTRQIYSSDPILGATSTRFPATVA